MNRRTFSGVLIKNPKAAFRLLSQDKEFKKSVRKFIRLVRTESKRAGDARSAGGS